MPRIEVLATTGRNAPSVHWQTTTAVAAASIPAIESSRKRGRGAATSATLSATALTARQQAAVLRHVAELDRDGGKESVIPVPTAARLNTGVGKKATANVRRILASQKTWANHLADEEALVGMVSSRGSGRTSGTAVAATTTATIGTNLSGKEKGKGGGEETAGRAYKDGLQDDDGRAKADKLEEQLLKTYGPDIPDEQLMLALVHAPALTFAASRATLDGTGLPRRQFCETCGYWGRVRCIKCGVRICGLACKAVHDEGRCLKFYA